MTPPVLQVEGLAVHLRGEGGVAQIGPGFVEYEERGPPIEARFEGMDQAGQHGAKRFRPR